MISYCQVKNIRYQFGWIVALLFSFNLLILANRDVWWHTVLWILSLLVV